MERRTALSSHPRATVLSLRSMELMRAWGLEARVRERSADVDFSMLEAETLADAAAGTAIAVGYPSAAQSRVLSPVEPACVAQDDVEPLLLAPGPAAACCSAPRSSRSTARARRCATWRSGAERVVEARYIVAADGAQSALRAAAGIRMLGAEDVLMGVTTLIRAPLWDVAGPHRHLLYSLTRTPSVLLPTGPSDRWLFAARDPGDLPVAELVRGPPACRASRSRSSGRARSPPPPSSPSGSAPGASCSPATPRTA